MLTQLDTELLFLFLRAQFSEGLKDKFHGADH